MEDFSVCLASFSNDTDGKAVK